MRFRALLTFLPLLLCASTPLPPMNNLTHGQLDNGMEYYIARTTENDYSIVSILLPFGTAEQKENERGALETLGYLLEGPKLAVDTVYRWCSSTRTPNHTSITWHIAHTYPSVTFPLKHLAGCLRKAPRQSKVTSLINWMHTYRADQWVNAFNQGSGAELVTPKGAFARLKADDVLDLYNRRFKGAPAKIIVATPVHPKTVVALIEEEFGSLEVSYSEDECKRGSTNPSDEICFVIDQSPFDKHHELERYVWIERPQIKSEEDLRWHAINGIIFETYKASEQAESRCWQTLTKTHTLKSLSLKPKNGEYDLLTPRLIQTLNDLQAGNIDIGRVQGFFSRWNWDTDEWFSLDHWFIHDYGVIKNHLMYGDALYDSSAVIDKVQAIAKTITADEIAAYGQQLALDKGGIVALTLPDNLPNDQAARIEEEARALLGVES